MFYTDGTSVYNSNNDIMLNGDDLLGNFSSTQSALIIPNPVNYLQYYIFTVDVPYYEDGEIREPSSLSEFNYSIVDMSLDSGLGAVIDETKNTRLLNLCSEKVSATAHSTENAIWLLT